MNNQECFFENSEPIISMVQSECLSKETFRLDGQFYVLFDNHTNDIFKVSAYKMLKNCCSEIYEVPLFKHIYVEEGEGVPFYTSSGLFEADLIPSHYLSPFMPNLERYRIKKGQILMARSGNVDSGILGQILMAGNILHNRTTSDHIIRFTPNENEIHPGYLCAFLMSEFCRGELLKNAAGSVIPAIRPDSLSGIKIPSPERGIQEKIGDKILTSIIIREEANYLLNEADRLVYEYNHLPPLKITDAESLDDEKLIPACVLKSSIISGEFRLDAHYFNPLAELAAKHINESCVETRELSEVTERVFYLNRFTRTFVDKQYGIPYLAGKDIIKIRPNNLEYLSKQETEGLSRYFLEKGWILLTRSGTIGRTCFIWGNYENFAATDDIIRIVANSKIDKGYLYAFLSSDYGYHQIIRYKHGAVIDHVTPEQLASVLVAVPKSAQQQMAIGDKVRLAYEKRAEAIHLEEEAQEILKQILAG